MYRGTRAWVLSTAAIALFAGTMVPASASASTSKHSRYAHPVARKYVASATTWSPTTSSARWDLVYRGTFTTALNTTNAWSVYNGRGTAYPGIERYGANHVTVSGGQLHLKGYVDPAVEPDGRIVTGGLGLWHRPRKYFKIQMLVRVQPCADVKYAFLLWPYSGAWPEGGEVDFAEDEGGNRQGTAATLHYAGDQGQNQMAAQDFATPIGGLSDWHVIGVEWTPSSLRYTIDGTYWGAAKTDHIPDTPMVPVMQTEAVSRASGSMPAGGCNADIAWVNQWQYKA